MKEGSKERPDSPQLLLELRFCWNDGPDIAATIQFPARGSVAVHGYIVGYEFKNSHALVVLKHLKEGCESYWPVLCETSFLPFQFQASTEED